MKVFNINKPQKPLTPSHWHPFRFKEEHFTPCHACKLGSRVETNCYQPLLSWPSSLTSHERNASAHSLRSTSICQWSLGFTQALSLSWVDQQTVKRAGRKWEKRGRKGRRRRRLLCGTERGRRRASRRQFSSKMTDHRKHSNINNKKYSALEFTNE